jgi:hypothetical protein
VQIHVPRQGWGQSADQIGVRLKSVDVRYSPGQPPRPGAPPHPDVDGSTVGWHELVDPAQLAFVPAILPGDERYKQPDWHSVHQIGCCAHARACHFPIETANGCPPQQTTGDQPLRRGFALDRGRRGFGDDATNPHPLRDLGSSPGVHADRAKGAPDVNVWRHVRRPVEVFSALRRHLRRRIRVSRSSRSPATPTLEDPGRSEKKAVSHSGTWQSSSTRTASSVQRCR